MHNDYKWLQLFAEGGAGASAGEGGAATAATGVTASAAEEQVETQADRLRKLGVPENRIRAKYKTAAAPAQPTEPKAVEGQAANATADTTTTTKEATAKDAKRMTWDEIMADPEYNKEMQKTMAKRVAKSKAAEEAMDDFAPVLELLAQKYEVDVNDRKALRKAIEDDDDLYEKRAMELGTSVEVAKRIDKADRLAEQQEQAQKKAEREAQLQEHFRKLTEQGNIFKEQTPNFDLNAELGNPKFVYMTQPGSPISVDVAYKALHFDELVSAAVSKAVNQMSAAVQSQQRRPQEGGASKTTNASVTTFDYKNASKEQREALKARIRAGEKIFPGQF